MNNPKQGQAKQGQRKKTGNKNKNQNKKPNPNAGKKPVKKAGGGNRRPNNRRPNNRRRRPAAKLTGIDMITTKYNNLLEQYLVARRKYHDLFFRADPNQKAKLERVYNNATQKFIEFKDGLKPEDRELFEKHYNGLKLDLDYSSVNELNPVAEAVPFDTEPEEPHQLISQVESDYSDDTEESVGSLEDYKAYKGL